MGKGDRKTRRGKTYRGSYGNTRAHGVSPAGALVTDVDLKDPRGPDKVD